MLAKNNGLLLIKDLEPIDHYLLGENIRSICKISEKNFLVASKSSLFIWNMSIDNKYDNLIEK